MSISSHISDRAAGASLDAFGRLSINRAPAAASLDADGRLSLSPQLGWLTVVLPHS